MLVGTLLSQGGYVFCDNHNCQKAIREEINLALSGLIHNRFLSNLHGFRKGKQGGRDGDMWFSQRRAKEK